MDQNLRRTLEEGAMSRFQWIAVTICILLNALDGFDVLVMAFTAASVSAEWKLSGAQLGVLFSAGLVGMAVGSIAIAPLADRWGRQRITLICLSLISVGMVLSGYTQNLNQLTAMRALTGLGIGGMLASVTVIIGEFSNKKWRSTSIALYTAGYPLGATIGGLIAAWLMVHYGWRSVFIAGGIVTALMIPVVIWRLPESVDFLMARRPKEALQRVNRLLCLMERPMLECLPELRVAETAVKGNTVFGLFKAGFAHTTAIIWSAFFFLMFGFYFAVSWTPKLLVTGGLSATQGVTGGVLLNLGGIVGGVLFGLLAVRSKPILLTGLSMLLAAASMVAFGASSGIFLFSLIAAFAIGTFLFASMAGLYGVAQAAYPVGLRSTGIGYAIGIGRLGAVLAPMTAGILLDSGWKPDQLYYTFAIPLMLAMIAVFSMLRKTSSRGG